MKILNNHRWLFKMMKRYTEDVYLIRGVDKTFISKRSKAYQDEIYALKHLDHPAIPNVLSWDSSGAIFLEYMPGTTLDQHKFSEDQSLSVFLQICNIMKYVHAKGFYHSDLKPSNIIYSADDNQISIIDWEYALPVYVDNIFRGTPLYMAPEGLCRICSGTHLDVWSLGVILYEMLCREMPFSAQNIRQLRQIVEQYSPNYLHPNLPKVARKLLQHIFVHYWERLPISKIKLDAPQCT